MHIRNMIAEDWEQVAMIYHQGILTGNATFQQDLPKWEVWNNGHLAKCRIIMVSDERVVGWAALSPISLRYVYRGVAEVSVYVHKDFTGQGIGYNLLKNLTDDAERNGIWTLQSSIFPENKPSIKIHEKCGFRQMGFREKIGQMNGIWRDTVIYEKRSKIIF